MEKCQQTFGDNETSLNGNEVSVWLQPFDSTGGGRFWNMQSWFVLNETVFANLLYQHE